MPERLATADALHPPVPEDAGEVSAPGAVDMEVEGEAAPLEGLPQLQYPAEVVHRPLLKYSNFVFAVRSGQSSSGGQNDEFRPLTSTLGGRGMGWRDKYVTS